MTSLVVFAGFFAALFAPLVIKRWRTRAGTILSVLPFLQVVFFLYLLFTKTAEPIRMNLPWGDIIGLSLAFNFDGLGLLFAVLISGIGFFVCLYASGYLKGHQDLGRFYFWLFIFMASMLGVVLSDNLILLFIFWELTSLSSFFLIGFKHDEQRSRDAALQALLVTGLGGLVMLAGFVLIGEISGTYVISELFHSGNVLRESALYLPALILVLAGAFTKSAQFPFHFWLPNAMEAPTPVSAYLHSATMVKAGVYLLARLLPIMGGTAEWQNIIVVVGAITTVIGAILALGQTDLKRLLAYSTVSALGTMTLLLGYGDTLAVKACIIFITAHAFYKGALFMIAGSIDHEAGTRDIRFLGGLAKKMPVTAVTAAVAALSMAGVIPFFGFVAKEVLYERVLQANPWILAAVVFAAFSNVIVAILICVNPFWRRPVEISDSPLKTVHEAPVAMLTGPIVLAFIGLMVGIFASGSGEIIKAVVSATVQQTVNIKLALWHGLTLPFVLSLLTLIAGFGVYFLIPYLRILLQKLYHLPGPEKVYQLSWQFTLRFASIIIDKLQNGYLRYYLSTIIISVIGGAGLTLLLKGGLQLPEQLLAPRFYEIGLVLIVLIAAFYATIAKSRLAAVASMGAIGFSISILYLLFGAPDLSMTQFLIESLTVILFVVAFYHMPRFADFSSPHARVRDVFIALFTGALMTVLVMSSLGNRMFPPISQYYAENAYLLGHGRNVVNVILIDFRGIDTLGEITVLSIAALGVFALLKYRSRKGSKESNK
ncbi:MAG: Na(+)/H(+) antiporter subunit A [Chloroflexi bacterium HGW-Chloroflexi-5]|jgi:multicomponent Na+:H+ antiporter subunit A|nr:MAG: Na(+)/H(+) antiporter subunit A [Chloroflexi bacterium HGW-Chloroflexi-5]